MQQHTTAILAAAAQTNAGTQLDFCHCPKSTSEKQPGGHCHTTTSGHIKAPFRVRHGFLSREVSEAISAAARGTASISGRANSNLQRYLSEVLVFVSLGLCPADEVWNEEQIKTLLFLPGTKTPEGVFHWVPRGPLVRLFGTERKVQVTVEVKRIAFAELPDYLPPTYRHQYHQQSSRTGQQSWWFTRMIQDAVGEVTPHLAKRFGIEAHIIGIAVPMSMGAPQRRQIRRAVQRIIADVGCCVPCDVWVVREPLCIFGNLLRPSSFQPKGK